MNVYMNSKIISKNNIIKIKSGYGEIIIGILIHTVFYIHVYDILVYPGRFINVLYPLKVRKIKEANLNICSICI